MMTGDTVAGKPADRLRRRRTGLLVALSALLPLLSMLAGAALAAYRYGML